MPMDEWHAFGIMSASRDSGEHAMVIVVRGDFTQRPIDEPPTHLWVRGFHFPAVPYCLRMYRIFVTVATGAAHFPALTLVFAEMLGLAKYARCSLAVCACMPHHIQVHKSAVWMWPLAVLFESSRSLIHGTAGAGIGVVLSPMIQHASCSDTYLIWIARSPKATYGSKVEHLINKIEPQRLTIIDTDRCKRPDIAVLVAERAKAQCAEAVLITSNPKLTKQVLRICVEMGIRAFGPIRDS